MVNFKQWFGLGFPHSLLISIMASAFAQCFFFSWKVATSPLCPELCWGKPEIRVERDSSGVWEGGEWRFCLFIFWVKSDTGKLKEKRVNYLSKSTQCKTEEGSPEPGWIWMLKCFIALCYKVRTCSLIIFEKIKGEKIDVNYDIFASFPELYRRRALDFKCLSLQDFSLLDVTTL